MPPKKKGSAMTRGDVKSASKSLRSAGSPNSRRSRSAKESRAGSPVNRNTERKRDKPDAEEATSPLSEAPTSSTRSPPFSPNKKATVGSKGTEEEVSDVPIPSSEQLLRSKRLQGVADQLSHSIVMLRTKLTRLEQRILSNGEAAVLPFQIRRAMAEKEQLEKEIRHTNRTIQRLILMSAQLDNIMQLRTTVFTERRTELLDEIAKLQAERDVNAGTIHDGFVDRINLLHRYWPWRQLLALGDTSVAATFEEELQRGPRYRHVGIQNNIQSDYIEQQLHWLEALSSREEMFRSHLRQLDSLVEDLIDINDLLETTLTCSVCHLLYEEPVVFWPCGHSFCVLCFDSLAIAPSLYRCPVCGSMGSEGFVHNLLLNETVAKWMFKDSGYGDVQGPLNSIRMHLSRFRKDRIESRVHELKQLLHEHQLLIAKRGADDATIAIAYRAY